MLCSKCPDTTLNINKRHSRALFWYYEKAAYQHSHRLEASIKYKKLMEEYEQSIGQSGKIGASLHQICQVVDTCFSTSGLESNNNISMLSMSTNPAAHSVHRAAAGSLPLPELVPRQAQKPYRKWCWPKSPVFALPVDPAAAFRLPQQLQTQQ